MRFSTSSKAKHTSLRRSVLFFLTILFLSRNLAFATEVANIGRDWIGNAALPEGWQYLESNAANGGTEVALSANQTVGDTGTTGFGGGGDGVLNLSAVTGNGRILSESVANNLISDVDLAVYPASGNGFVILRYTISAEDLLNGSNAAISGSFRNLDNSSGNSVEVFVYKNGTQLFTANAVGSSLPQADGTFNITTTVTVGDRIDFVVSSKADINADETAVRGNIVLTDPTPTARIIPSGSTGPLIFGTPSTLTFNVDFSVGTSGNAQLFVSNGADLTVVNKQLFVGRSTGGTTGVLTVDGDGSTVTTRDLRIGSTRGGGPDGMMNVSNNALVTITEDGSLRLGDEELGIINLWAGGQILGINGDQFMNVGGTGFGTGILNISETGRVAQFFDVEVRSNGTVNMIVNSDAMIDLQLFVNTAGQVNFIAGSVLAAGSYVPVSAPVNGGYNDVDSNYQAVGGVLSFPDTVPTITVSAVEGGNGESQSVSGGSRWSFDNAVTVGFNESAGTGTIQIQSLPATIENFQVLHNYRFLLGDGLSEQLTALSFNVGTQNREDLTVFRRLIGDSSWVLFEPTLKDLTNGIFTFTVSELSGFDYAVAVPSTPYKEWAVSSGLSLVSNAGFNDDPNNDGILNIDHFANDTNPLGSGVNEGKFRVGVDNIDSGEFLTVTRPVRLGTIFSGSPTLGSNTIDGVDYTVWGDDDLMLPFTLEVVEAGATLSNGLPTLRDINEDGNADWEYRTFRLSSPISARSRGFIGGEIPSSSPSPSPNPEVEIAGVTIEDVSSELGSPFNRQAVFTIDGSGLNMDDSHSNGSDGVVWLSTGTFQAPNDTLPVVITYDLEGNYDLSSIRVWNYNEINFTNRGANLVEILVAATEGGAFTSLGNFNLTEAPGADNVDFSQIIDLSSIAAADDVRLVRFNIQSNHGDTNQFTGLAEIRFTGASNASP